jgi:hypothetical protein
MQAEVGRLTRDAEQMQKDSVLFASLEKKHVIFCRSHGVWN